MTVSLHVEFVPKDTEVYNSVSRPMPAKMYFPDYIKDMPNTTNASQGMVLPTATRCVPLIDSYTSGYIQELACDIQIVIVDKSDLGKGFKYTWAGPIRPMSTRGEEYGTSNLFPKFYGFYDFEMHWNTLWEPKTPRGYSTMYHHPSNRFDLPFFTFTGIIDTDSWHSCGPLPFLLKEGFEGIIPAGTPIYQMTFVKRDSWTSSKKEFDKSYADSLSYKVRRYFRDGYRKVIWNKKRFE